MGTELQKYNKSRVIPLIYPGIYSCSIFFQSMVVLTFHNMNCNYHFVFTNLGIMNCNCHYVITTNLGKQITYLTRNLLCRKIHMFPLGSLWNRIPPVSPWNPLSSPKSLSCAISSIPTNFTKVNLLQWGLNGQSIRAWTKYCDIRSISHPIKRITRELMQSKGNDSLTGLTNKVTRNKIHKSGCILFVKCIFAWKKYVYLEIPLAV